MYFRSCDCPACASARAAWTPVDGCRWRLAAVAVVAALVVAVGVTGRADSAVLRSCPQYEPLLAAHGMPVERFSRIMWRESRCRPNVVNRRSGARGLLQVMPQHVGRWNTCPGVSRADLSTPAGNVACAAVLYQRAGVRPWSTR